MVIRFTTPIGDNGALQSEAEFIDFSSDQQAMNERLGTGWEWRTQRAHEERERSQFASRVLPVVPVGAPLVYLAIVWLVDGFRKAALHRRVMMRHSLGRLTTIQSLQAL